MAHSAISPLEFGVGITPLPHKRTALHGLGQDTGIDDSFDAFSDWGGFDEFVGISDFPALTADIGNTSDVSTETGLFSGTDVGDLPQEFQNELGAPGDFGPVYFWDADLNAYVDPETGDLIDPDTNKIVGNLSDPEYGGYAGEWPPPTNLKGSSSDIASGGGKSSSAGGGKSGGGSGGGASMGGGKSSSSGGSEKPEGTQTSAAGRGGSTSQIVNVQQPSSFLLPALLIGAVLLMRK